MERDDEREEREKDERRMKRIKRGEGITGKKIERKGGKERERRERMSTIGSDDDDDDEDIIMMKTCNETHFRRIYDASNNTLTIRGDAIEYNWKTNQSKFSLIVIEEFKDSTPRWLLSAFQWLAGEDISTDALHLKGVRITPQISSEMCCFITKNGLNSLTLEEVIFGEDTLYRGVCEPIIEKGFQQLHFIDCKYSIIYKNQQHEFRINVCPLELHHLQMVIVALRCSKVCNLKGFSFRNHNLDFKWIRALRSYFNDEGDKKIHLDSVDFSDCSFRTQEDFRHLFDIFDRISTFIKLEGVYLDEDSLEFIRDAVEKKRVLHIQPPFRYVQTIPINQSIDQHYRRLQQRRRLRASTNNHQSITNIINQQ